jgi:hypothetical protein
MKFVFTLMDFRIPLSILSFVGLALSTQLGAYLSGRRHSQPDEEHDDFDVIVTATLTLLGLIIGFSFSALASRSPPGA